jgi:prepilin-type N-terminal cleavage/methylation domain-containing protein
LLQAAELLRRSQVAIRRRPPRAAFTLIEILIVVVITAVLAGVVITRYIDTSTDARRSVLKHNLHILRSQIGLYNISHPGQYPELIDNNLPQLTCATNHLGVIGAGGSAHPYGPYVDIIPNNPFNNSSKVVAVAQPRLTPTAPADDSSGWQYDETTGDIWPNHREYFK